TVPGADNVHHQNGPFGDTYGDYNGLSGIAGRFFPSWTDRRNGAREEIWTAAITTPAKLKIADDTIKDKFADDSGTSKVFDDGTIKSNEDIKIKMADDGGGFPKPIADVKTSGMDMVPQPGMSGGFLPQAVTPGTPFILSTPHHSM